MSFLIHLLNAPLSWELKLFFSLLALHQFLLRLYLALALGKRVKI